MFIIYKETQCPQDEAEKAIPRGIERLVRACCVGPNTIGGHTIFPPSTRLEWGDGTGGEGYGG